MSTKLFRPAHLALALSFIALAFLPARAAHAQSLFMEKGESGFTAAGGVAANGDGSAVSLGAGYSHEGIFDIGAILSRTSYDNTGWLNARSLGVRGYANLNLSLLGATVSYERLFFSTDVPTFYDVHMSGWGMFVGAFAHLPLDFGKGFGAVPQATIGINHTSVSLEVPVYYYGIVASNNDSSTSPLVRIDGNFTIKDRSGRTWTVDPMVALDKDDATFGLYVGGVFH